MSNFFAAPRLQHTRPPCLSIINSQSLLKLMSMNRWCQLSHPLSSPSPLALNLSQHQGLFQWVSSSHQVAKVLESQFQHQSNEHPGLISFRIDWLNLLGVQGTLKSSPTPQFKSIHSLELSFLCSPTLTSIHDHWKNHSLREGINPRLLNYRTYINIFSSPG